MYWSLVGIFGVWVLNKLYAGKHVEPDNVFIKKEYRSKGVGQLMIDFLFQYAKEIGCEGTEVNCYVTNEKGRKFWERQGYEPLAEDWKAILKRPTQSVADIEDTVNSIFKEVAEGGDVVRCLPILLVVREIVLCSPPNSEGKIHPAILYTAALCGITKIFKAGGIQAIAAMTFGTESIPQVYKIFGPGNQYVTVAKQIATKHGVAIDMPAGPSELLVVADDTANAAFVASDLLSQAEHGVDSQVILVATSKELILEVEQEITKQIADLPRKEIAQKAIANSKLIYVEDDQTAIDLINEYGPEHYIVCVENEDFYLDNTFNAGSVFIGNYTPESAGDYASGTNHTLPTNGYAKQYSGVNLDSFLKNMTFQKISKEGIQEIGSAIEIMAEAEGLQAHKNAVTLRLNKNITRENIKGLKPYSSARDEYLSDGSEMVFLDANENPFENGVNRYPDPQQRSLKAVLAGQKGIEAENLLLGNGSDEVLDLLFRAFCEPKEDNIISLPPTYGMYKVLSGINDIENREVLLTEDFQPDVTEILKTIDERSKILFICSPNNPTGNSISKNV
ncbi:putative histidine biosynthesis bifunctional protein HisCD [Nymphon striatum]|nr:putative histidine biosynthesis bifunctional protein HisCD [Nymphon striatum]